LQIRAFGRGLYDSVHDLIGLLYLGGSFRIYGLGFPLACDFLKELGYRNFAKPDVHIRDIFTALALCPPKANNYQIFKAIVRVAHNCSRTPYDIDKLFWLVGSGFFYDDPQVGKNGRIGSLKRPFIAHIQSDSLFQMV
jgi:hypothetical protein